MGELVVKVTMLTNSPVWVLVSYLILTSALLPGAIFMGVFVSMVVRPSSESAL